MLVLFVLLTFVWLHDNAPPQPAWKKVCNKGKLEDCYKVNVWDVKLPPQDDGDCLGDEILQYNTENIKEASRVIMTFAAAVLRLKPQISNYTDYCKSDEAQKIYNMTLRVRANSAPNGSEFDASITDVVVLPSDYKKITHDRNYIWKIVSDLHSLKYVLQLQLPGVNNKVTYFASMEYLHPDNEYKCYLEVFLYSCWVKDLFWKVLGILISFMVLVLCAVFVPVCCCCTCLFLCLRTGSRRKKYDSLR